jgi:hypothetical protein
MTERDTRSHHVHSIEVVFGKAPFSGAPKYPGCEGFIERREVDVPELERDSLERRCDGRNRANARSRQLGRSNGPGDESNHRAQPEFVGAFGRGHDTNRCTIVLARRVAGRRRLTLEIAQDRPWPPERLDRRIQADALVPTDDDGLTTENLTGTISSANTAAACAAAARVFGVTSSP